MLRKDLLAAYQRRVKDIAISLLRDILEKLPPEAPSGNPLHIVAVTAQVLGLPPGVTAANQPFIVLVLDQVYRNLWYEIEGIYVELGFSGSYAPIKIPWDGVLGYRYVDDVGDVFAVSCTPFEEMVAGGDKDPEEQPGTTADAHAPSSPPDEGGAVVQAAGRFQARRKEST